MKKQRLIELQEKSENGNAELKDVVEILSELFLTQSQYNKELLSSIGDLSAKVNKLQTKIKHFLCQKVWPINCLIYY